MKIQNGVENVARLTAESLGEGWSSQQTMLGAQLTGPGGARILMELNGDLIEVGGEGVPYGAGVPSGTFPLDHNLVSYFVGNALYPRYMAYLADAKEEETDRRRWLERTKNAIARLARSAGARAPDIFGQDGDLQSRFLAHDCWVSIEAHHRGEDTIRITVPPHLDLGNLSIDWDYKKVHSQELV